MRSQVVVTHYRCNQNCAYCVARRAEDERAWVQPSAVRARIDDALREGASELIFTGGEPTMRGDLAALLAYARGRGARSLVVETNATLLDDDRCAALRDAGLARAVVNLAGWGEALDRVTRDEGGFARTLAGIDALLRAGVRVELKAAVVRSTAPLLPELPEHVRARWPEGGPALLWITVPDRAPDESELLAPDVSRGRRERRRRHGPTRGPRAQARTRRRRDALCLHVSVTCGAPLRAHRGSDATRRPTAPRGV